MKGHSRNTGVNINTFLKLQGNSKYQKLTFKKFTGSHPIGLYLANGSATESRDLNKQTEVYIARLNFFIVTQKERVFLPQLTLNFFDLYVDVQRMPPTLRPFKYRSFGHLIVTLIKGKP